MAFLTPSFPSQPAPRGVRRGTSKGGSPASGSWFGHGEDSKLSAWRAVLYHVSITVLHQSLRYLDPSHLSQQLLQAPTSRQGRCIQKGSGESAHHKGMEKNRVKTPSCPGAPSALLYVHYLQRLAYKSSLSPPTPQQQLLAFA